MVQNKKERASGIPPAPQEVVPSHRIKIILSWQAPERIFKPRNKEFWTTVLSIALLVSVILFFAKEYFLIAVIFALIFLYYILSTQPPKDIEYKITNQGLVLSEQKYAWGLLEYFFIDQEENQEILYVNTLLNFPKRLILPLGKQDKKEVSEIMEDFLPYHKPDPSFIDKSTDWLAKTFPLDTSQEKKEE
ncbi:MAG: hypothetical protein PHX72_02935 [Candidatus Shapirobacteria bacterium]|nr:hypothetical protein [Candidatus Shapirobacteria bacterium]